MMLKIALQLVVVGASIAQSATTPLRTGDVARQLPEQDVAALESVLPAGVRPWLLNGDQAQIAGAEYIEAYLPPTNTTRVLRRGTVITVMRRHVPVRIEWTVQRTESYAQVAIPGRNFDQIEGDQDINRPFQVIGRFDDTELFRLVEFLRSNPPTRVANAIPSWPILSINRKADDSVDVRLRGAVMQGQSITLRQAGQDWVIIRVGMWIV